jgi:hypothetical protein
MSADDIIAKGLSDHDASGVLTSSHSCWKYRCKIAQIAITHLLLLRDDVGVR